MPYPSANLTMSHSSELSLLTLPSNSLVDVINSTSTLPLNKSDTSIAASMSTSVTTNCGSITTSESSSSSSHAASSSYPSLYSMVNSSSSAHEKKKEENSSTSLLIEIDDEDLVKPNTMQFETLSNKAIAILGNINTDTLEEKCNELNYYHNVQLNDGKFLKLITVFVSVALSIVN